MRLGGQLCEDLGAEVIEEPRVSPRDLGAGLAARGVIEHQHQAGRPAVRQRAQRRQRMLLAEHAGGNARPGQRPGLAVREPQIDAGHPLQALVDDLTREARGRLRAADEHQASLGGNRRDRLVEDLRPGRIVRDGVTVVEDQHAELPRGHAVRLNLDDRLEHRPAGVGQHTAHPAGHGDVVVGGVPEGGGREALPLDQGEAAGPERGVQVRVLRG